MGAIADAAAKVVGASTEPSTPSGPTLGSGQPRVSEVSPPPTTDGAAPASERSPGSDTAVATRTPAAPPSEAPSTAADQPTDEKAKPSHPAAAGQPATPSGGDPTVALKNARTEIRSLKAVYGWMPREHAKQWRGFYEAYHRDPVGALIEEIRPYLERPDTKARLSAILGGPQKDADPEPDFDLETQDGRPLMSPQRAAEWRAWNRRQEDKRLDERLRPIQQSLEERQMREVHLQMQGEATQRARQLFAEARTWPHFNENLQVIHERFNALIAPAEEGGYGLEAHPALLRAYQSVLQDQVRRGTLQQGQAAAAVQQSKVGATTHNPTRAASAAGQRRPMSIREAAERVVYGRAS